MLLCLALPGLAAARQAEPGLLLSGSRGVTGSKRNWVEGIGLLPAVSPNQNEGQSRSTIYFWRGARRMNLLILHPASLFPDCSLPLISQHRFCLPLCSYLLFVIFNNKMLFPKTWRFLFLQQIHFHLTYIKDLFPIHKNLNKSTCSRFFLV